MSSTAEEDRRQWWDLYQQRLNEEEQMSTAQSDISIGNMLRFGHDDRPRLQYAHMMIPTRDPGEIVAVVQQLHDDGGWELVSTMVSQMDVNSPLAVHRGPNVAGIVGIFRRPWDDALIAADQERARQAAQAKEPQLIGRAGHS